MTRITLFDFLLTLQGGGQRVCCHAAEALSSDPDFEVTLYNEHPIDKRWLEHKFSVDLSRVTITDRLEPCDVFLNCEFAYWAVDPRIAPKRIIMAHDAHPLGRTPDFLPLYQKVIVNSNYSKEVFRRAGWPEGTVVYPPMYREQEWHYENKENLILVVGRFDHRRAKNSFPTVMAGLRAAFGLDLVGYRAVFAGWVVDEWVLAELKLAAEGFPITFETNLSDYRLRGLYNSSKIVVNLRGIDVPEEFGFTKQEAISLVNVEAIAQGCIPIVYDRAGHRESVPLSFLRAADIDDFPYRLCDTIKAMDNNPELRQNTWEALDEAARKNFSFPAFVQNFKNVVASID